MDLYNDSHEKVCILSGIKETCITSTLKTGDKEITFEFRKTNRYAADIKEEGYIRTDTDEFVIKQVEPSGEWYKCTGTLNVEELEGKQYPQGFETVEKTVDECLTEAIDGTGWKVIRRWPRKKRPCGSLIWQRKAGLRCTLYISARRRASKNCGRSSHLTNMYISRRQALIWR